MLTIYILRNVYLLYYVCFISVYSLYKCLIDEINFMLAFFINLNCLFIGECYWYNLLYVIGCLIVTRFVFA